VRAVFVLPDHERLIIAQARCLRADHPNDPAGLRAQPRRGSPVKIITLPDRFLTVGAYEEGGAKVKADLDGCVAAGMTSMNGRT